MALTPSPRRAQPTSEGAASAQRLLDDTSRAQMPRPYLLDTGPSPIRRDAKPPLRLIKTRERAATCGFGVCNLDPACTSECRYREADQALGGHYSSRHTQRADMPPLPVTDHTNHRARRLAAIGILVWFAVVIGVSAWAALR